jgi:hypothetical protein
MVTDGSKLGMDLRNRARTARRRTRRRSKRRALTKVVLFPRLVWARPLLMLPLACCCQLVSQKAAY